MKCPVLTNTKPNLDWGDISFRLLEDNTYRLSFINEEKEIQVKKSIQLSASILVGDIFAALDNNDKILYISFNNPHKILCQMDNCNNTTVLPPTFLSCEFFPKEDALVVYFIHPNQVTP